MGAARAAGSGRNGRPWTQPARKADAASSAGTISTTRFRSEFPSLRSAMTGLRSTVLSVALLVLGCASSGVPSQGIASKAAADAYLPLSRWSIDLKGLNSRHAAALVVAPRVAVTNAHNANLLPPDAILAQSDYDLLFFRTEKLTPPSFAKPSQIGRA